MDYIDKLLETEEGAKTLKAHLKSVPKYEKAKPQFQRLWKLACEAVNKHHNIKQKKLRDQKKTHPDTNLRNLQSFNLSDWCRSSNKFFGNWGTFEKSHTLIKCQKR